eukprot:c21137_g1_i1 orf=394-1674(-)
MVNMATCRSQTLAGSTHFNAIETLRDPLHPHCPLYNRNLGLAHLTDQNPHPGYSYGFHRDPLCKTGLFLGLCRQNTLRGNAVRAACIGLSHDPRLHKGFSLCAQRRNASLLRIVESKCMLSGSIWLVGNRLGRASNVMFRHSSGLHTSNSAFAAAAWRKDRGAQMAAFAEQSNSANEEILLFFFQLDLTTRLQRALNLDQYEAAQQLREKMVEVDKEIARLTEAKLGSASSKDEAQDKAITILRLKNDLQQAIEKEDYNGAAELRDQISKLEAESLAAAARALAFQNVEYNFRLGQKVVHAKYGYRGVVCGMDPLCSESDSWCSSALIQQLSRGKNQPFYQVLVDMRAEPDLLVAYVAEDNLMPPKEPDKDSFEHPYVSFLFYGMDSAGDFIPIKQLREKYNQPRHELPWEEGREDDTTDGGDAKP